jgi:hypothetical protein
MKYQFRSDLLREMAAARLAEGAHPELSMSRITRDSGPIVSSLSDGRSRAKRQSGAQPRHT